MPGDVHTASILPTRVQLKLNPGADAPIDPGPQGPDHSLPSRGSLGAFENVPRAFPANPLRGPNSKNMNLTNEAILALLLELKADMAGLKRDVAALKAADEAIIAKIEVLNNKITYLAEEMGMI